VAALREVRGAVFFWCERGWQAQFGWVLWSGDGPAAGGEEIFPPGFVFAEALLFAGGEWRAGLRDGRERGEADGGAEGVHLLRIFDAPGAGEAVARVVEGLSAVALRRPS
jgi:hypothetical protein